MRLLQIIINLSSGGAERITVDLCNEFAENANIEKVYLMTLFVENKIRDEFYLNDLSSKINYIQIKNTKSIIGKVLLFFKVYLSIKKIKPDVVHFHLAGSLFFSLLSVFFNRKPSYFQTLHTDAFEHKLATPIPMILQKLIYRKFVSIYSISEENENTFQKCYGFPSKGLILNGRKEMKVTEKYEEVKHEINTLKNDSDTLVFINIARCHPLKNHLMLIEAFNKYNRTINDNAVLLIIGSNFDSTKGRNIRALANEKIIFLGEKRNIADYLMVADAFCLSSLYEGMPITLIEALSFGVVPISTPTSGAVDIFKNGIGFISHDFSSDSFCKALNEFTLKQNDIDKEKIRKLFETKYSIEKCSSLYFREYKKLLIK